MFKIIRPLVTVSRPEFLPANLGSLIMGLSMSINSFSSLTTELPVLAALSFAIITLVSALGAQLNTMFDYDLDLKDERKRPLVQAMRFLGRSRLSMIMILEFVLSMVLVFLLLLIRTNPALLFLWAAGNSLAYAYSVPPLRLKSRSWLAMGTLFLVLCILPILFVYYTVTSYMNPVFLLFLGGQALTVYGLIIPTEIRDYWGDSAMNVETMTVRLGLVKASLFGMALLIAGGILSGTAFFIQLASGLQPLLSVFLIAMAVANIFVLRKYKVLYRLSKEYTFSKSQSSIAEKIITLSAQNPKWITLVSQSIVFVSVTLLVSKFLP